MTELLECFYPPTPCKNVANKNTYTYSIHRYHTLALGHTSNCIRSTFDHNKGVSVDD